MLPCDVWLCYIEPMFHDETVEDLAQLDARVRVLEDGEVHAL